VDGATAKAIISRMMDCRAVGDEGRVIG